MGSSLRPTQTYLIDRCRLNLSRNPGGPNAQVLFFQRTEKGNCATVIGIDEAGRYPTAQPPEFRDFFPQRGKCSFWRYEPCVSSLT